MVLVVIVVVLLLILLVLYRARRLPKETGEHRPAIDNIIYGNRESKLVCMTLDDCICVSFLVE